MRTLLSRQFIERIDVQRVSTVAFQNHELLVVEHQIGAFIKSGKNTQSFLEFEGPATRLFITARCVFTQFYVAQDLAW